LPNQSTATRARERDRLTEEWVRRSRDHALDHALAERLHPSGVPPMLLHECADGHRWREQPDGGVSPSYGLAGTSVKFDGWEPSRCPEPERLDVPGDPIARRGIACASCGHLGLPFDMLPGLSCTPWLLAEEFRATGHVHEPPRPACGLPAIKTMAFTDGGWVEVLDGVTAAPGEQIALL